MTLPNQPEPNPCDRRPQRTTKEDSDFRTTPKPGPLHDNEPNHAGPLRTEETIKTRVHAAPTTEGRNTEKDSTMINDENS
jgi:hypothetical protein